MQDARFGDSDFEGLMNFDEWEPDEACGISSGAFSSTHRAPKPASCPWPERRKHVACRPSSSKRPSRLPASVQRDPSVALRVGSIVSVAMRFRNRNYHSRLELYSGAAKVDEYGRDL